jgi:hypothetical protein
VTRILLPQQRFGNPFLDIGSRNLDEYIDEGLCCECDRELDDDQQSGEICCLCYLIEAGAAGSA